MTNEEIAVGKAALATYVKAEEGWRAEFISDQVYQDGAICIIKAADAVANPALKNGAACRALRLSINATGYGGDVTNDMITMGVTKVLDAVNAVRAKLAPPAPAPDAKADPNAVHPITIPPAAPNAKEPAAAQAAPGAAPGAAPTKTGNA
jgi:hypothetical protein